MGLGRGKMDARALSAATGVEVGTLNAWISRGYVPGIMPDAQGQRRDFDIDTAMHIGIMAALSLFGLGAPLASSTARDACDALKGKYSLRQNASYPLLLVSYDAGKQIQYGFQTEEDLAAALNAMTERPSVYLTINAGRIFKNIQQAEDEWQLRRKKTSGED
jgi:hypothetical protein